VQVIGAGLPRTATLTQKIALEMLGFGPCYHMMNVLSDSSLIPGWADALDGRADWGKIFAGFNQGDSQMTVCSYCVTVRCTS
jgi:hypothetical protein